jgi:hypothetical protein
MKTDENEKMKQTNTCYCDDPDHELCWDGIAVFMDQNCLCCQNTLEDMETEDIKKEGIE